MALSDSNWSGYLIYVSTSKQGWYEMYACSAKITIHSNERKRRLLKISEMICYLLVVSCGFLLERIT